MKTLERLIDRALRGTLTVFFSAGALLSLTQVILRFFLHRAVLWIDPVIQYLFAMAALLGAAYAAKTNDNLKMEVFRGLSAKRPVIRLVQAAAALLSAVLLTLFILRFREEWTLGGMSDFGVPRWALETPYLLLFSGMVFFFARAAWNPSVLPPPHAPGEQDAP